MLGRIVQKHRKNKTSYKYLKLGRVCEGGQNTGPNIKHDGLLLVNVTGVV
jgi:hypothetical protein